MAFTTTTKIYVESKDTRSKEREPRVNTCHNMTDILKGYFFARSKLLFLKFWRKKKSKNHTKNQIIPVNNEETRPR